MSTTAAGIRTVRIDIGFSEGTSLSARVDRDEADSLRAALEAGDGWHTVTTADGTAVVALHRLAYLHVDDGGQPLGFG